MKPIKVLELSEVDRLKLEKGYHNGPTHSFRIRCKSILLKSEGKSAPQIAEMLEVTVPTVYAWVKRYEENGIKGLETRPGQGRKPIMDCSDEEAVRMAIEEDRQSVSKAREAWQNATGKETSDITFKRFLETFVQDYSLRKCYIKTKNASFLFSSISAFLRKLIQGIASLVPTCPMPSLTR